MEQVNNLLTNTNELKGCLESTFSAVSELLNNRSPARRPINATPPRPTHTKKLIRNILHKSHSQFKHLILAQRKEIIALRKLLRAANTGTPTITTPTTSNTNTTTTPPTASAAPSTSTSVKSPVLLKTPTRNVKQQQQRNSSQQAQTMRKRVISLLKRHRILSLRLTGNEIKDTSTLSELRSITAGLADLGIQVPLTGPTHTTSPSSSITLTGTPSTHASIHTKQTIEDDSKHFEFLFAKIMSGPSPIIKQPEPKIISTSTSTSTSTTTSTTTSMEDDASLAAAIEQQLFVSTPSPKRRKATVRSASHRSTPSLLTMTTPPRSNGRISPRNPTPGSRKRARIGRCNIELNSSNTSEGSDGGEGVAAAASSGGRRGGMQEDSVTSFVPQSMTTSNYIPTTTLHFSSPSSSYEMETETETEMEQEEYNTNSPSQRRARKQRKQRKERKQRLGETRRRLDEEEKQEDGEQQRMNTTTQKDIPSRLFVRTPNRKKMTNTESSISNAFIPSDLSSTVTNVSHYSSTENDAMIVGSPFPPMSPILEPVDRSGIFPTDDADDIISDLHVVKTLNMMGGAVPVVPVVANVANVLVPTRTLSGGRSPPVKARSRSHQRSPTIPFIDARPKKSSTIPLVRRVRSPRLSNHQNLRSSIRLARKAKK